jgi:hypothetical protein
MQRRNLWFAACWSSKTAHCSGDIMPNIFGQSQRSLCHWHCYFWVWSAVCSEKQEYETYDKWPFWTLTLWHGGDPPTTIPERCKSMLQVVTAPSPNPTTTRSPFLSSKGQALSSYPWASMDQVQNLDCADPFEARPNPILPFIWKAHNES